MNQSPYGSPMNWSRNGHFQGYDVGNLTNQVLTRLGAELSWIPEGKKKEEN